MKELEFFCNHPENKAVIIGFKKFKGKQITRLCYCCTQCMRDALEKADGVCFASLYWSIAIDAKTKEVLVDTWNEKKF